MLKTNVYLAAMAMIPRVAAQDMQTLLEVEPRHYVAYQTLATLEIDGRLDEPSWQRADWTSAFVNVAGGGTPALQTRVKMLWDDDYFYVAADLEDPHVWGTLTARDSKIYHDNDFEIFIDPDGDTHEYYEIEINALGAVWDLFLLQPYRDGGPAVSAWDMAGMMAAVTVWGTVNNPKDVDRGWSLELALPWIVLKECAHRPAPPRNGDQWRVNFDRVQWQTTAAQDGEGYVKVEGKGEENWAWSPQGVFNMHFPEQWGFVMFAAQPVGRSQVLYADVPEREAARLLREIYYRQRDWRRQWGAFATDIDSLGVKHRILRNFLWPPQLQATDHAYEASLEEISDLNGDGQISRWAIRQDSKMWKIQPRASGE